jgi:hypothetical protein
MKSSPRHSYLDYTYSDRPAFELNYSPNAWRKLHNDSFRTDTANCEISLQTNFSNYDWQIVSRPISVRRNTRYCVEFDLRIMQGRAGVFILNLSYQVLAGAYWRGWTAEYETGEFILDTGLTDSILIVISNYRPKESAASSFSIRDLAAWEVTNYSRENPPLTRRIAARYPRFEAENLADWERVNILREWVYHAAKEAEGPALLEKRISRSTHSLTAEEIFYHFQHDRGGGKCGLIGMALMRLYQFYGYPAYLVNMGDVGGAATHVVALVQINWKNKPLLAVEDAYLNLTFSDPDGLPLDYFRLMDILRRKESASFRIVEGDPGEGRSLLGADRQTLGRHWMVDDKIDSSAAAQTEGGLVKCTVRPSLSLLVERWPADWREFLRRQGCPPEVVYLYLFPFSIHNGTQKVDPMLQRAEKIIHKLD